MEPSQFGVEVPDACNHIAKTIARCMKSRHEDSELGVLQIDISNAFNSLHRQSILSRRNCLNCTPGQVGC